MRKGLRVLQEPIQDFDWTVEQLDQCSTSYGGCKDCPDLDECVYLYDQRCQHWRSPLKPFSLDKLLRR